MAEDATQNIRVAVRCRPLSKKELGNNEKSIFSIDGGNVCLRNPNDSTTQKFNFDGIFPDDSKQTEIWDWLGQPLLDKCIEGFNGTVRSCTIHWMTLLALQLPYLPLPHTHHRCLPTVKLALGKHFRCRALRTMKSCGASSLGSP